LALFYCFFYK